MTRINFIVLTAFVMNACSAMRTPPSELNACGEPDYIIIGNAWLANENHISDIHIRGSKIEKIVSGTSRQIPKNSVYIDAHGAIALPGFIDAHTHFDTLPAGKSLYDDADPKSDIFAATFRQALSSGITGARVHLTRFEDLSFLESIENDSCYPSPKIETAGPGLLGGAPGLNAPLMKGPSSLEEISVHFEQIKNGGATWIALHGISRFTDQELDHIDSLAAENGIKVMVDADKLDDLRKALSRPIHSLEYINRSDAPKYPEETLDDISDFQGSLYWTAPIGYYDQLTRINLDTFKISESHLSFYPDHFGEVMQEAIRQELSSDTYVTSTIQNHATHASKFTQLQHTKITSMISTDAGSPAQFHHDAIWREFQTWHTYGVPMNEILAAATVNPAEMLGWKNTGKIAPGYDANIILYKHDFLEGEIDRDGIELVMKEGLVFVQDGEWVWEK